MRGFAVRYEFDEWKSVKWMAEGLRPKVSTAAEFVWPMRVDVDMVVGGGQIMNQHTVSLDYLRGEAEGVHKSIQAALKAGKTAAEVELLKHSLHGAKQLHKEIQEAAKTHHAAMKQHLEKAAASLALIASIHEGQKLKDKADDALQAADETIKHIAKAIAEERAHA
jgi:hypothetical protein